LDGQLNLEAGAHRIALDTSGSRSQVCFVSHAHSDHTAALKGKGRRIIASEATLALAGETSDRLHTGGLDGLKIELLPSGHMLGSRQLRVESDSKSFTYTGDFKLGKSLTAEPAVVKETDCLLIEGTFGEPGTKFPDRHEVCNSIAEFVTKNHDEGHIVLLGGYTLGKAEELVAIVNQLCKLKPVASEKIAWACGVYSKFGVPLEAVSVGTPEADELMKDAFVSVMPFHQVNFELAVQMSRQHRRSVYSAVATGWAASTRFPVDEAFPLSDHADFHEIIEYVEAAKPKQVFCCHGNEGLLSRELSRRGYNAQPAGLKETQLMLSGW